MCEMYLLWPKNAHPNSAAGRTYIKSLRASGLNGMVKTAGRNVVPGMNDLEREMINIAANLYIEQRYHKDIFQAHSVEQLLHGIGQGQFAWIWSMNSKFLKIEYHV